MEKRSGEGPERRLFQRKKLRIRVVLEDEFGAGFIYFYTTDVSLGGLFIESEIPLKIGTRVFLSFRFSDTAPPIRTTGEVMRLERLASATSGVSGMGIRFLDLENAHRQAIEQYVGSSTDN